MQSFKEIFHDFIASLQTSKKRFLAVLFTLALVIGLPLSLVASQTEQQIAQHASGRDAFVLPTGSKLLFNIRVDGFQPNLPVVFYIITKDVNNTEKADPNHHIYITDNKGTISFPVDPSDRVIITPLISRGYHGVTPDVIDISVLQGRCGISTPCVFIAHGNAEVTGPITPSIAPTCIPRPACLDDKIKCQIALPFGQNWCSPTGLPTPTLTCIPRPPCLDSKFKCEIAEPAEGWCPSGNPSPVYPSVSPVPSLPPICPQLSQACHYAASSYCKLIDNQNVCTCGEVICQNSHTTGSNGGVQSSGSIKSSGSNWSTQ